MLDAEPPRMTAERRNELARALFEAVIDRGSIVGVMTRPEAAGFFTLDGLARVNHYAGAEVTGFALASALSDDDAGSHDQESPFPAYFSLAPLPESPTEPPRQKRPRIAPSLWPTVARRAQSESLRELAAEYGVSHMTIRNIIRRVAAREATPAAAD